MREQGDHPGGEGAAVTPAVQAARDAAVTRMREAGAFNIIADTLMRGTTVPRVVGAIDVVSCYDTPADRAALHHLAILLAAMTEPEVKP